MSTNEKKGINIPTKKDSHSPVETIDELIRYFTLIKEDLLDADTSSSTLLSSIDMRQHSIRPLIKLHESYMSDMYILESFVKYDSIIVDLKTSKYNEREMKDLFDIDTIHVFTSLNEEDKLNIIFLEKDGLKKAVDHFIIPAEYLEK